MPRKMEKHADAKIQNVKLFEIFKNFNFFNEKVEIGQKKKI